MMEKGLYAASIGLIFLTLGFAAPSAVGVSSASPEKVQADHGSRSGSSHSSRRTRGPRYVFVGGYTRGK